MHLFILKKHLCKDEILQYCGVSVLMSEPCKPLEEIPQYSSQCEYHYTIKKCLWNSYQSGIFFLLQDEKYWTRRKKNNVAAKRSRDARRLKENQITIRAAFLEKENTALRTEVAELRKEVGRCKNIVSKYETRYGPL